MQVLRFATRAHIEAVFEENHELWGAPFSLEEYRDHWFSLFLTPWGSSNFRYMALTEEEDGPLLSSLKLYRFTGRLYGEPVIIAAIGAVYTPKSQRTYGSASLLLSEVMDYMQKKRAAFALLFSDIGLPFYERLGYLRLPARDAVGVIEGSPRRMREVPGVVVREVALADAKRLASFSSALTQPRPLVIDRDAPLWEFILFRRRRFWAVAPAATGQAISLIALRDGRVVAMGFAIITSLGMRLQELGSLEGEQDALCAILDRIWAAAAAAGSTAWRANLPAGVVALDKRLRGNPQDIDRSIPMAAPLGETASIVRLASDPDCHIDDLDHI